MIDTLIPYVLALITFGIGSSLKFEDFRSLYKHPKAVFLGLALQMTALPLMVALMVSVLPLSPSFKVGLFILSLCPGGSSSNFISYLLGLDTALSIALTSINSLLILISIPVGTNLALDYFMGAHQAIKLPIWPTVSNVFFVVLFPALLGLLFNTYFEKISQQLQRIFKVANVILLATVFSVKIFGGESSGGSGISTAEILNILPAALLVHLLPMLLSFIIALRLLSHRASATTIGIEVGLQNTTLALMVTGTLLNNAEMTKPALVYAMFSFFTSLLFGYLFRQKGRPAPLRL